MTKLINFIKNEIVFVIALFLAIISVFIITPSSSYIDYIDFKTLALLLALMLVVQGLKSCGLFDLLVLRLLRDIDSRRKLAFIMVSLCFFGSMLITNDVALITFVPFTVLLLSYIKDSKYSIYLIVLETIAANLGSMFTPIGNPQN
ncbi:MAG: citrate transporter, partial [Lachnospiraceae bacterium]|nr:citrate transporter [Lachnospiraceae bacterium]